MRASIADYKVREPWARAGRYVCEPPDRLNRPGPVMVFELGVDAEGWPQLCDHLVRLASVSGMLEVIEVGPDLETGGVFLVTEPAVPAWPMPSSTVQAESGKPGPHIGQRPDLGETAGVGEAPGLGEVIDAVVAAARCLHDLHEAGLTHGAVHRDAFLRTGRGTVLDLPVLDGPPGQVTRTGSWVQLVATSPELLAGEPPSRSSDVWALGASLHTLLSPEPLFVGVDRDEPVTAVQRIMFTRPEMDRSLPAAVSQVIRECLAADPADRPADAAAVADRLTASRLGSVAGPEGGDRTGGGHEAR